MNLKLIKELVNLKKKTTFVQFRFSFLEDSLTLMGEELDNLQYLHLAHSVIHSLRDIGTTLKNLQILNLEYSKLKDTSGLNSFPQLKELYIGNNLVSDLSGVAFHDSLVILGVQKNEIQGEPNVDYIDSLNELKVLLIQDNKLALTNELANIKHKYFIDHFNSVDDL